MIGGSYYFKVGAYNEINAGTLSQASQKIIAATIPGQPSAPSQVSQSKTSITISWTPPTSDGGDSIVAYEVRWNAGSGSVFSALKTHTDLAILQYTKDTLLSAGSTYEFKVVAINEVGPSIESGSVAIKAADAPASPLAPSKVSADRTSIQISWQAPNDDGASEITGYKVFWDNNTGTVDTVNAIATVNAQTLTYLKTGLTEGLFYKFAVLATNEIGESEVSDSASIIAATIPGQPQTPSLLSQSKT